MQQVQLFIFGLLVIWLVATGKLRALYTAFITDPSTGQPKPMTVTGPNGQPLTVYG